MRARRVDALRIAVGHVRDAREAMAGLSFESSDDGNLDGEVLAVLSKLRARQRELTHELAHANDADVVSTFEAQCAMTKALIDAGASDAEIASYTRGPRSAVKRASRAASQARRRST